MRYKEELEEIAKREAYLRRKFLKPVCAVLCLLLVILAGTTIKMVNTTATAADMAVVSFNNVTKKEIEDAKIADATEVMQYLTSVVRKESRSEVVVVEGIGEGCSEARLVEKPPDEREALDAAKTLAKIYGLEKNNLSMNADMNLNISIDYGDDD